MTHRGIDRVISGDSRSFAGGLVFVFLVCFVGANSFEGG